MVATAKTQGILQRAMIMLAIMMQTLRLVLEGFVGIVRRIIMELSVISNIKQVTKQLGVIERRQIPFAASRTLNKVAVAAQSSIVQAIPHIFNNRKKWWGKTQPTGIKVKFASKYELVSAVYTRAYFATIQEEGGIKKPHSGMHLAIPASNVPKKFRKSNALSKEQGNSRIFKSKSGKSILRRTGKLGIQKLYTLSPQAHVRARFGFKRIAYKVFNRRFDDIFKKQLDYALRTAL